MAKKKDDAAVEEIQEAEGCDKQTAEAIAEEIRTKVEDEKV